MGLGRSTLRRVLVSAGMRPTPLEKSAEPDLGTDLIPKERYTERDFAQREWDRMWTRVWLLAGREPDVAKPGDWFTFDIGPESIIVARDRAGVLHAHYNVCLHRGNRLCEPGMGHSPTFSCRYHAWEWNLDGTLRHATDARDFTQGLPAGLRLGALRVDTWGGWVWVTMSSDVEPLREYLGVVPEHLAPYRFDEHVLVDDVTLAIDCNWKTCVDAFNEAYHVQGTHPELLEYSDDVNVQIDLYGRHSRFIFPVGVPSPRLGKLSRVPRWLGDIVLRGSGIDPETFAGGPTDVKAAAIAAGRRLAESIGMDLTRLRDDQLLDDYHYTIFPNVTLNVHGRGFWLFRHRPHPTDPNKMLFDFQDYLRWPASLGPRERAPHRTDVDGGTSLGVVLDQDLYNLPRVQAGMRSRAFSGLLLNAQERRIRHFHRTLDAYLTASGG
jgi:phenylpropionate dioxygenase-like ring-hydroxylating dioxygenase large terminal subunit